MSEPQIKLEEDRLSITQVFDAPIDKLFACFTEPELLSQWHAPDEMQSTAEVELKVGGAYRIAMKNAEGQIFTAVGEYREIQVPGKIVYTWGWAERELPETLITVILTDLGEQTSVELIHEGFLESEEALHHSQGWTSIFTNLGHYLVPAENNE